MKFDENLRALRREKDISQEYLAERMNVSRQTISKWENGTAMPDLKKLSELVELFDTTMDELLGTVSPVERADDIVDMNAYIDSVVFVKMEQYTKKNNTKQMTLSLAVIFLAISIVIMSLSFRGTVKELREDINRINTSPQVVYRDDDNSSSIVDDVRCVLCSIDKATPNIAEVYFEYVPRTYVKGTSVSFIIKDYLSSQLQPVTLTADQNGKQFSATTRINFASINGVDISVDDGTNVTTESLYIDWLKVYREFEYDIWSFTSDKNSVTYEFLLPDNTISWANISDMPEITDASIIAKNGDKEIYSKKLDIKSDADRSYVLLDSFSVNDVDSVLSVRLMDEYNTSYIFTQGEDMDLPTFEILFRNGGRLTEAVLNKENE